MTVLADAREAVYQRFKANWTSTPYALENEKTRLHIGNADWARVSVRVLAGGQYTLGEKNNRRYERQGMITIEIFTLKNKGMRDAGTLGEAAQSVFEGESFSGVWCLNSRIRDTGTDGKWQKTSVEVDIRYYETK